MDGPQLSIRSGEGANAVDLGQLLDVLSGRGIVSGGAVHEASEPFAVQVLAVDAWFADSATSVSESQTDGDTTIGTSIQRSSATISLREWVDDTHPRKILVCLPRDTDGNVAGGDYHVVAGEPKQAQPSDFGEFWATAEPALPDLSDRPDLIPLAAGWLGGNADDVTESNLWQRRQRPDAALRKAFVSELVAGAITDGAGVTHEGELADAENTTPEAIRDVIDSDPDHGSRGDGVGANHAYTTEQMVLGYVRGAIDVAELSGSDGTDGQLPFSTGDGVNWATPPDEWGDIQALIDAATADGVVPVFTNGEEVTDLKITGTTTWPDGTTTTESPQAAAGNVAVLADLGDVDDGPKADRPDPSGTDDFYFAHDGGIYHDDPAADPAEWELIAVAPGDIDNPDQLGFDVATQDELDSHDGTSDAHHTQPGPSDFVSAVVNADGPLDLSISGDAATLGGNGPDSFARSDVADTVTADRTFDGSVHLETSNSESNWLNFYVSDGSNWGLSPTFNTDALTLYDYLASSPVWVAESGGPFKVRNRNVEIDDGQSLTGGTVESDVPGGNVSGQVASAAQADNSAALDGRPATGYERQLTNPSIYQNGVGEIVVLMEEITDFISPPSATITGRVHVSTQKNYAGGADQLLYHTSYFTFGFDNSGNARMSTEPVLRRNSSEPTAEYVSGAFRIKFDPQLDLDFLPIGNVTISGVRN